MGLSICKMFIELMGGQVGADSIEMIGSTFWFEVPFEKQPPEEMMADLSAIPIDQIRVAAVSDESKPSSRLTKVLDRLGMPYSTCNKEQVAHRVLMAKNSAKPVHVVIMEVSESDRYAKKIRGSFQPGS